MRREEVIYAWCDGSITGGAWANKHQKATDPVPTIWGGWFAEREDGTHIHHESHNFGTRPSNSSSLAEYFAVRSALHWLSKNGHANEQITIYNDSQVCMRQLTGEYRCNTEDLRRLWIACKHLERTFPKVHYVWQRREMMRAADLLSKALQIWGRQPTWEEVTGGIGKSMRKLKKAAQL